MENHQATVNIFGLMDHFSKEISWMVWGKVKVSGEEEQEIMIVMKVDIGMIRNGDTESLLGQVVIYIKEIMKEI